MKPNCADCGGKVGDDFGPPNGWVLEDGRTVCHACCVKDTKQLIEGLLNKEKRLQEMNTRIKYQLVGLGLATLLGLTIKLATGLPSGLLGSFLWAMLFGHFGVVVGGIGYRMQKSELDQTK